MMENGLKISCKSVSPRIEPVASIGEHSASRDEKSSKQENKKRRGSSTRVVRRRNVRRQCMGGAELLHRLNLVLFQDESDRFFWIVTERSIIESAYHFFAGQQRFDTTNKNEIIKPRGRARSGLPNSIAVRKVTCEYPLSDNVVQWLRVAAEACGQRPVDGEHVRYVLPCGCAILAGTQCMLTVAGCVLTTHTSDDEISPVIDALHAIVIAEFLSATSDVLQMLCIVFLFHACATTNIAYLEHLDMIDSRACNTVDAALQRVPIIIACAVRTILFRTCDDIKNVAAAGLRLDRLVEIVPATQTTTSVFPGCMNVQAAAGKAADVANERRHYAVTWLSEVYQRLTSDMNTQLGVRNNHYMLVGEIVRCALDVSAPLLPSSILLINTEHFKNPADIAYPWTNTARMYHLGMGSQNDDEKCIRWSFNYTPDTVVTCVEITEKCQRNDGTLVGHGCDVIACLPTALTRFVYVPSDETSVPGRLYASMRALVAVFDSSGIPEDNDFFGPINSDDNLCLLPTKICADSLDLPHLIKCLNNAILTGHLTTLNYFSSRFSR